MASTDIVAAQTAMTIQNNCFWTRGALTGAGVYDWLAGLPIEVRLTLPNGTRVLLVHASPETDEVGIRDERSDTEERALLADIDADLVIVGHTHRPLDRSVNGMRVWNTGSVSNPVTSETRAIWTLLEADDAGYRLERHYAVYDVARMLSRLEAIHHPAEASIRAFWAGK
ncbi:MAG: metallophosphoesterase family protein [Chloroflexota bacterium]|nr:metallophosphoesterase family protein [Chloroflexota bacterium]